MNITKKAAAVLLLIQLLLGPSDVKAQASETVFNFLRLPTSAHVAALGGDNVSIDDGEAALVFHNPALLSNEGASGMVGLNMMTYMQGCLTGSASFSKNVGERAAWGVQGRFITYGEMKETTYTGEQTGTFSAHDMSLGGTFAYRLWEGVSGGITAKMVSGYIGNYSSLAAAVDLGLSYQDAERGWSIGAVARNLGGQLSAFDDEFEPMPLDLQLGVTKRLIGAPLRFSATLVRLNDWQYGIGRHLVVGADILLSDQFYIAGGYNALRAEEMKISSADGESSHGAALSLGAGMRLDRIQLHVAYGSYHVSAPSLVINFNYKL